MVEQLHELQDILDQEIVLHPLQMGLIVEAPHALQPFGLLQNEDIGVGHAGSLQHAGEGKDPLLLGQLLEGAGIVGPGRGVLGIVVLGRHHVGGHLALKGITLLQDVVALAVGKPEPLQHIAGGIHISGLGLPAVRLQLFVVHGVLEGEGGRSDIDSHLVRLVGIGGRKAGGQGQSLDGRPGIGQIGCHLLQTADLQQGGDDLPQGLHPGGVPGIPVQPHLIVVPHQLLAVGDVGVGKADAALQDLPQLLIHLQLAFREGVIGDVSGGNGIGGQPVPVDGGVKILGQGEAAQLLGVLDQVRADPGVGAGRLGRIGFLIGEGKGGFSRNRRIFSAVCNSVSRGGFRGVSSGITGSV